MKTWKGRQQKITREKSFAKERELSIPMKSFAGSMRETARKTINVKHHYHWLDDGNKTSFEVDNDIFCGCCCRRRLRLRRHVNLLMACNRRQEFWFTKWETQILLSTSFLRIRETLEDKWHWRSQVLTDKRGIRDFVSVSDVKYETLLLEFSTQVPNPLSFLRNERSKPFSFHSTISEWHHHTNKEGHQEKKNEGFLYKKAKNERSKEVFGQSPFTVATSFSDIILLGFVFSRKDSWHSKRSQEDWRSAGKTWRPKGKKIIEFGWVRHRLLSLSFWGSLCISINLWKEAEFAKMKDAVNGIENKRVGDSDVSEWLQEVMVTGNEWRYASEVINRNEPEPKTSSSRKDHGNDCWESLLRGMILV